MTRDWGEEADGGRGGWVRDRGGEWEGRDLEGVRRGKEELTEFGMREGTVWGREVVRLGEAAESAPRRGEAETWPWLLDSSLPPAMTWLWAPLALITAAALWNPI